MRGLPSLPMVRTTRARILLVTLGLLGATLVAAIVADRLLLQTRLSERIDRELVQETEELRTLAGGIDPDTGEPFGDDIASVYDTFFARNVPGDDEVMLGLVAGEPYALSPGSPYPIQQLDELVEVWGGRSDPTLSSDSTPAGELRSLALPIAASDGRVIGTFVVGQFPERARAELSEATRLAVLVSGVAFVVASLLAWVFAGRVLAPLERLMLVAERIAEDDLSHRVEVRGTGELTDLSNAFNDMLDRLNGSFGTLRGFLDDAGHELRTPITVVRGHLELSDPDEPLPEATRAMVFEELDRIGRLLDDLLAIAKAEHPDFLLPTPTDVADLTSEIAERARLLEPRDERPRQWSIHNECFVVAELDRERIVQAWMNLVRNAIQHSAPGDDVLIFSRVAGTHLELGVADTGEGVAAGDRERIFQRFARGTSALRNRSDGSGLGLAIVAAIAAAHGGSVEYADTPGGGATFIIRLPLGAAAWPES